MTVTDSLTGTELQLDLQGQRVLSELGAFFEEHELDVNDALPIRRAEDGTISITPRSGAAAGLQPERARSQIVAVVLENAPLTEAEARALLQACRPASIWPVSCNPAGASGCTPAAA